MSVKVMALVWDHYPVGGGEMLLALALADWASHDGGGIWPSVRTMASKTIQSERAVQYQLQAMKRRGWLTEENRGGGRQKTTIYRMPIDRLPQGVVGRVQNLHPFKKLLTGNQKGCNPRQERVQIPALKGATIAPDPSLTIKKPLRAGEEIQKVKCMKCGASIKSPINALCVNCWKKQ